MKKIFLTLLASVFSLSAAFAQHFDDYFIDRTLRVNYFHIGDHQSESMEIHHYTAGGVWSGTRSFLIEPNFYGDIAIEVFDSLTNKLIYSRSYSCLFTEYKTTERAKTEVARMEECVNVPFPKKTVRLKFTSYDRKRNSEVLYDGYYNPRTTPTQPMKKE